MTEMLITIAEAMVFRWIFQIAPIVLEVHFNACVDDQEGDGHITGTEIWVTPREDMYQ